MSSTNFESVLGALRSLADAKLSGLDETYRAERGRLRALAGPPVTSALLAPSPPEEQEAAGPAAGSEGNLPDPVQDKENAGATRKGRGCGKKAGAAAAKPAARKGTRTRGGAAKIEEDAVEAEQTAVRASTGSWAMLETVPEADESASPAPETAAKRTSSAALRKTRNSAPADGTEDTSAGDAGKDSPQEKDASKKRSSGSGEAEETGSRRSGDSNTSAATADNTISAEDTEADEQPAPTAKGDAEEVRQEPEAVVPTATVGTPSVTRVAGGKGAVPRSPSLADMTTPKVNTCQGVSALPKSSRRVLVPKSTARKRSLLDDTPLAEINQQLRTASKTVSCRKKRARTPQAFSFAIPPTTNPLFGPATAEVLPTEPAAVAGQDSPSASHSSPALPAEPTAAPDAPETVYKEAEADTPQFQLEAREMEVDAVPDTPADSAAGLTDSMAQDEFMTPSREGEALAEAEADVEHLAKPSEAEPEASQTACAAPADTTEAFPAPPAATEPDPESAPASPCDPADDTAPAVTAPARGNIMSTVMSFIPLVKASQKAAPLPAAGKSQVKVKALEAANAARKEAEAKQVARKQRLEAAKQRREAARAGQTASSSSSAAAAAAPPRGPALASAAGASKPGGRTVQVPSRLGPHATQTAKAEHKPTGKAEAPNRAAEAEARRTREEQERKERQERVKRMAQTATSIRQDGPGLSRVAGIPATPAAAAAGLEVAAAGVAASTAAVPLPAATPGPAVSRVAPATHKTPAVTASVQVAADEYNSYEISPYKSSSDEESDSDDERRGPRKPIPQWASSANLTQVLQGQQHLDPDEIFQQKHIKTCNLDAMFRSNTKTNTTSSAPKRPYSRRGSSGNWIEDRVTWQEELAYKKAMGFRAFA